MEKATVRSLAGQISSAPIVAIATYDEERDNFLQRIAKLEERLHVRDAEIGELRLSIIGAREDGLEQGYESGLAAAHDRQSERLALLEEAIQRAQADLVESLSALSRLSALLARDCVEIVLGSATDRIDFIGRIIESQVARIDRAMLVDVRVSRLDFPDEGEVATLIKRTGLATFNVLAADEMPSGSCTIALRLGSISVGIDQQWSVLRNLLGEMALPENAP
jgi:flagellar biosynthesis/type III secretory pathway protein FliH